MTPKELIAEMAKRGLSQLSMGKRAGCSQATISRIADGNQKPSYEIAKGIEDLYKQICVNDGESAA